MAIFRYRFERALVDAERAVLVAARAFAASRARGDAARLAVSTALDTMRTVRRAAPPTFRSLADLERWTAEQVMRASSARERSARIEREIDALEASLVAARRRRGGLARGRARALETFAFREALHDEREAGEANAAARMATAAAVRNA